MSEPVTRKFILNTEHRSCVLTATELPDRILISTTFSKTGSLPDIQAIDEWLGRVLAPYDKDPRPLQSVNPVTGQVVTCYGDENSSYYTIFTPFNAPKP